MNRNDYFPKYRPVLQKPVVAPKPIRPTVPPPVAKPTPAIVGTPEICGDFSKKNKELTQSLSLATESIKKMDKEIIELKTNIKKLETEKPKIPNLVKMDLYFSFPENMFLGGNFLSIFNRYIMSASNLSILKIIGYLKNDIGSKRYIIKPNQTCKSNNATCYKGKGSYNVVYDIIKFKDDDLAVSEDLIVKINLDENKADTNILILEKYKRNTAFWEKINKYLPEIYYYGNIIFGKSIDKYNYYITKKYNTFSESVVNTLTMVEKLNMIKQLAIFIDIIVDGGNIIGDIKMDNLAYDGNKNIILIDYDSITSDINAMIATYIPYEMIGFFNGKLTIADIRNINRRLIDRAGFAEFVAKMFYPWAKNPVISWGENDVIYQTKLNVLKFEPDSKVKRLLLYLSEKQVNIMNSQLYKDNKTNFYKAVVEYFLK